MTVTGAAQGGDKGDERVSGGQGSNGALSKRFPRTWEVAIPAPAAWISLNDRMHWAKKAALTKSWRLAASLAARKAGLPTGIPHVHITATVTKPSRRAFDVHNLLPSLKAAIDGLVDYGLVADDSTKYLTGPDMRGNPDPGPAAVGLTISALECCGAIFPTRPHHGEYIGTAPHAAHCKQTVGISMPKDQP